MTVRLARFLLSAALMVSFVAAQAVEKYQESDGLDPFTTKDQHEKDYTLEPSVRLVIVAFEMGPGKAANSFLATKPADFLERNRAVFLADIHGMPGLGRMFALPKMKKYPHRILLADVEGFLARYPEKEAMLTVLQLDEAGKIAAIKFVEPKSGLPALFAEKK